jgi:glycosyltransferase involved in cell wall biosynthesis
MHVASLADRGTANGFYRAIGPLKALQTRGHEVELLVVGEERRHFAALDRIDVLHVHRFADAHVLALAREARARGIATIWDDDDDVTAVTKMNASRRKAGNVAWERRLAFQRKLLQLVHLVTTPSEALAQRFRDLGARHVAVLENYVPDEFSSVVRRAREGITVGWIAGIEHRVDLEQLPLQAVLQQLLDEDPRLRVITIGLHLGLQSDRYAHVKVAPLHELAQHASRFDVGIAPIVDIPFNRTRSNIKVKEYASAGVPWLASPIGPYAGLGEQQGGRLVPDDRWDYALRRLIDKERDRRKLAKRGCRWVRGETLSRNIYRWERLFNDTIITATRER